MVGPDYIAIILYSVACTNVLIKDLKRLFKMIHSAKNRRQKAMPHHFLYINYVWSAHALDNNLEAFRK